MPENGPQHSCRGQWKTIRYLSSSRCQRAEHRGNFKVGSVSKRITKVLKLKNLSINVAQITGCLLTYTSVEENLIEGSKKQAMAGKECSLKRRICFGWNAEAASVHELSNLSSFQRKSRNRKVEREFNPQQATKHVLTNCPLQPLLTSWLGLSNLVREPLL